MSWQCEAVVVGRDGTSRRVMVTDRLEAMDVMEGRVVWAAEPGRGAPIGRIALEEACGWPGFIVRVDGVVVGCSGRLERALRLARKIEANPAFGAWLRERWHTGRRLLRPGKRSHKNGMPIE